jgi:hypothetical protein
MRPASIFNQPPFSGMPQLHFRPGGLGWFMKSEAKLCWLVLLIIISIAGAGCQSTPPVNWASRVGSYTFDQAVTEMGPPDQQYRLINNQRVAEWITHRSGGTGFSIGTGFYGGPVGLSAGQTVVTGASDRMLTLTFDTNNILSKWSKHY